jgi:uncharacterized protein (DUF2062 family)
MTLDSAEKWIIAFVFGSVMVGIYSWSRFDEPSYDSQSEYFSRYKPRFSTSYARYARAKWAYVGAMILIYVVFSLVPELFNTIVNMGTAGDRPKTVEGLPLAAALGLVTLQNVPGLKELERRIRGSLHSVARIPDCVRRTVAQMRSSLFTFEQGAYECQTKKLNSQLAINSQQSLTLTKLTDEDEILHIWYCVGCVLGALSERRRDRVGIDAIFFAYYREEFDSIAAKHVALVELVRQHLSECLQGNTPADLGTLTEIRDLRDRLYTFVACGVHSTVKDEADSLDIVKRLGFSIPDDPPKARLHVVGPLAGLSFISLAMLSIFTGCSTQAFSEYVLLRVGRVWIEGFRVPTDTLGFFAWSWTTAAFYFTTIFGALAIRNSKIARREWFDINDLHRERPLLRYVTPILVGTAFGSFTLSIIAVIGGPGFKASFGEAGGAIAQSLPWFPLATVMALIVVVLSDSEPKDDRFWRNTVVHGVVGALIMTLIGFLTSRLSISISLAAFAEKKQLELTHEVFWTGIYTSLFIAAQIGLFAFVLCVIAQVAERYITCARSFAGKHVDLVTGRGREFSIFLDESGEASLFAANREVSRNEAVSRRGQWQLFPEGTAVKWSASSGEGHCTIGDFGLIRQYGDSVIYDGYVGQFSAKKKPVFDARADVRSDDDDCVPFRRSRAAGQINGALAPASPQPDLRQALAVRSVAEEIRS